MSVIRNVFIPVSLYALAVLAVAGPVAAGRGDDGTLRLLLWQAPTTLNPHLSYGAKDRSAGRIVYEPLASFDAEGAMVPLLAAEIPSLDNGGVAADGHSVTWKLRQDVKWADGEPFTADDVVFTNAYIANPEVGAVTINSYAMVERVEALDDHTLEIRFKDVNPAWALPFVGPTGVILPRHLFEPYNGPNADKAPANLHAVGTGPYRVAAFEQQDLLIIGDDVVNTVKITYAINPHYREPDKPSFAQVELFGGGDPRTAAAAVLKDGSVDYAQNLQVAIDTLEALEAQGNARLIAPPAIGVERIMINFADPHHVTEQGERANRAFPHPILTDRRVRQALSLAVDRNAISALYGRAGPVSSNLLISPRIYASPNTAWRYDLDEAAALLDEAGWIDTDGDGVRDKDGMPLHLVLQTSVNAIRGRTQEIVRRAMASIGVAIEPKIIDSSIFFGPVANGTNTNFHFYADMQMLFRTNENPEPQAYMRRWLCDEAAQQANNWSAPNRSRYCNPAYDALYKQLRTELDPDRRRALFVAMNDFLVEDVAQIPLVERRILSGLSNRIELGSELTPWDMAMWRIADWRRRETAD